MIAGVVDQESWRLAAGRQPGTVSRSKSTDALPLVTYTWYGGVSTVDVYFLIKYIHPLAIFLRR